MRGRRRGHARHLLTSLSSKLATDIASAPLDCLGVVQLSERLALALQARRPETLFGDAVEGGAQVTALASLQRISGAR